MARHTPFCRTRRPDGGHGRVEVRTCWASDEIEWLDPKGAWKGLRSIVMVERERTARGQTSIERAYYLTSCSADAAKLGDIVRRHGSIENSLHWTLDVTFDEDSSRIRSKNGVQNFAALRKIALALLKREASKAKLSVAQKRKRAGYLTEYLLVVLRGANAASKYAVPEVAPRTWPWSSRAAMGWHATGNRGPSERGAARRAAGVAAREHMYGGRAAASADRIACR